VRHLTQGLDIQRFILA